MRVVYGEDPLPATAVFMNAIELCAQYVELDFLGRTGERHGIVLPEYPQVQIALLAPATATRRKTIKVRLAIWALYGALLDMTLNNKFRENEWEIIWDKEVVASLFFTLPLDADSLKTANGTARLIPPLPQKDLIEISEPVPARVNSGTGHFDWKPVFVPNGKILPAKSVFLLTMGTLKAIAPNALTDKVLGPFHVGSDAIDANLQAYLQNRRTPRTSPPYFQFGHVLAAARRIPAWMLARRKFAEFFCSVEVSTRPVGAMLIEKGHFRPPSIEEFGGNISTS
ncbi:MAG: hypothetical protein Q9216_002668 [Gyalolechia sp. 2 TL-2023]